MAADVLLARARYRARQFLRSLRPHLTPAEVALARERLSPAEFDLFLHADPATRRHSMDLFHLLRRDALRRGVPVAADLLVAALLHDVGKGRLLVLDRVLFVALDAAAPPLARAVESEHGMPGQRALWRLRHHAALGAALLRRAGSSPRVVEIVARHTDPASTVEDAEIAWFQACDDRV